MNTYKVVITYIVAFPLMGILFGFLFFKLFDLINGPLSNIALEISLIVWGSFGFITGLYTLIAVRRVNKLVNSDKGKN